VLGGDGSVGCRRKAVPTVASLTEVEQAALAGAAPRTRLEVVLEPTGPSWLPIAVFFTSRGHTVYRVSSAKAHDLRRVLSRHAKSNGIDADTLARLPLVDPAGLHPLQLPSAERTALDRRVRACDRLTQQGAQHKRRLKDLVRQLLPTSPLLGELGIADLAVLERTGGGPHALLAVGPTRLARLITKALHGHHGAQRAAQWVTAARAALELYGDHPAVAFTELTAEVQTEVRLLRATQAELDRHAREREDCYRWVDPGGLARSLSGLATVGGPALAATMGKANRFSHAGKFCSFTGLAPRASETGNTDRKGQPISKAGNRLLRTTLVHAADHPRHLASIYYVQMVQRGKDHLSESPRGSWRLRLVRGWSHDTTRQGLRERAVRLVFEHQGEHTSQWAAICSIAAKFGISHETLRNWVRRVETDQGLRPGLTSDERERLKTLEREVRELRRANEILKSAAVFFGSMPG
jgi:transposase/transposase-like protein